jgi:alkylation response protein AidB-like acyl-CoA dehydrogenase
MTPRFCRIADHVSPQEEQMPYQDALARVIEEVIEPAAAEVDRAAAFPRKQIAALGDAGLLALTVPASFGGGGEGLRAAAHVTSQIGAVCGSTAMVATMHYAATRRARGCGRGGNAHRDRGRTAPVHARLLGVRFPQPLLGPARHRGRRRGCR